MGTPLENPGSTRTSSGECRGKSIGNWDSDGLSMSSLVRMKLEGFSLFIQWELPNWEVERADGLEPTLDMSTSKVLCLPCPGPSWTGHYNSGCFFVWRDCLNPDPIMAQVAWFENTVPQNPMVESLRIIFLVKRR